MKTINLWILLCMIIVPLFAMPPISRGQTVHVLQRYGFLKQRSVEVVTAEPETTKPTATTPTTTTSTTPKPEYKPTRDELQKIIDCYYHRQWQRTTEPLNSTQQFCKRLGTNQPNFTESSRVFRAFRFIWETLLPLVNNTESYTPTPDEIQEIEDCFFYRSWEWRRLSQLTFADLYCKRLAKNTPNREESGWMNHFKALRQVWLSMYDVANQDSTQMQACLLEEISNGYRPPTESCDRIYARIDNRKSHRDWRLEELYKCLDPMQQWRRSFTECSRLMQTFYAMKELHWISKEKLDSLNYYQSNGGFRTTFRK